MRPKNQETISAILNCINDYMEVNGCAPSTREIADAVGSDCGSVSRYIRYMEEQGMLERCGTRNISTGLSKSKTKVVNVPLVGAIACGSPILAEENIEEYLPVPPSFAHGKDYFFLRAKGDSMINAGIDDGDLVLIHSQSQANKGQIVVALVDDEEATLKRYYPGSGQVILEPENDDYEHITVNLAMQHFSIQGVAETVIKRLS